MSAFVEAPSVEGLREAEALFLMFHHLRLAAELFEATPENIGETQLPETFSRPAMAAWLSAMEALYPEGEY
jgi:hypothetical protein